MSTYEDEHDVSNQRLHSTLSSIIDSFLSNDQQPNQQVLTTALTQLNDNPTILQMLESLQDSPKSGVSSEFLDTLERVPNSRLNEDEFCPICTNKFKDDKYPLVVRLPCGHNINHIFDLDCIGPWLQTNSTCPMCRVDLLDLQKKRKDKIQREIDQAKLDDSEEEEDDWDIYG